MAIKNAAQIIWKDDGKGSAMFTQKIITDAMPSGYKPSGKDALIWFKGISEVCSWISEADQMDYYQEWLHDWIRSLLIPGYVRDQEYDGLYPSLVVSKYKEELNTPEEPTIQELTKRLTTMHCDERGVEWDELMNAPEEIF